MSDQERAQNELLKRVEKMTKPEEFLKIIAISAVVDNAAICGWLEKIHEELAALRQHVKNNL